MLRTDWLLKNKGVSQSVRVDQLFFKLGAQKKPFSP